MPRVTIELDRKTWTILEEMRKYLAKEYGAKITLKQLIEIHFVMLFLDLWRGVK